MDWFIAFSFGVYVFMLLSVVVEYYFENDE